MTKILLGDQKPIVTLKDFKSTYKDASRPESKETISFIESKGLLPLKYTSKLFPQLNILVSNIIWTGSASKRSRNKPRIGLSLNDETSKTLEEDISDLETFIKPGDRDYGLGVNGTAYARLISKIDGFFFSSGNKEDPDIKSRREFTLPEYLLFLTNNYEKIDNESLANKIIVTNLNVLMKNKLKNANGESYYQLALPENNVKDNVINLGINVIKMFNTVFPNIGLTEDSIREYESVRKSGTNFYVKIPFKTQNIQNAQENYKILIGY